MFGDSNPVGAFGSYHLWLSKTNVDRWTIASDLSNEENDGTFVNNSRVIYNMLGRFAGSPYHQTFDSPDGALCHYKWSFNDDDKFLGATDFNKIHQPGNGPGDDASLQREDFANTFLRDLGVPWLYKRYVTVFVNGVQRGTMMEDTQVPGTDVVKEHFPSDDDGFLYKMQPWFEMAPTPIGSVIGFLRFSWCTLSPFTTTGGAEKLARYRYNYQIRRTPDSDNDFTNIFSLVNAANASSSPGYVANLENIADMENWMRVFAANHAAGNLDSFGALNGQNLYGYIGATGTKYTLFMWDFNIGLGIDAGWLPGQNLFTVNGDDSNLIAIFNNPTFLRMYLRALGELCNGPLNIANSGALLDAKYNAFTGAGFTVENPNLYLKPWVQQAQASILSQLSALDASSFSVNPGVTVTNGSAILTGTSPVAVQTIQLNGVQWPLTWTSLTNWQVVIPLTSGTNLITVTGLSDKGQVISGTTSSLSVVYDGATSLPAGSVVINEIMYAAPNPLAQFVELYNNSTNSSFDLSGWKIPELNYTFAAGSLLAPQQFLVLAASRLAFADTYGSTNPVFDVFTVSLASAQTLTLQDSASNVVAKVHYSAALPWPTNPVASNFSLQLIDPSQDNWRVGNWLAAVPTPGATNVSQSALPTFPSLWLNEVEPDDLTGITNSLGEHVPWVEIFNPGTNLISLADVYLANNYTNLAQWNFPASATIAPQQFLIVFLDGQTNLSVSNELHANFTVGYSAGSLALSWNGNVLQVLDYLDFTNVIANQSYGSYPDGQSFNRILFATPTPGASNSVVTNSQSSYVLYSTPGSLYTQNFDTLPTTTTKSVNADNPVKVNGVTYGLSNPFDFAGPVSATSGGLGSSALAGWYGLATTNAGSKFGATDGDQTTGGDISFGPTGSSNRALGLLDTSSTGGTLFGLRLINNTGSSLNHINVQFTAELWRQSNLAKTLQAFYYIDEDSTAPFSTAVTGYLPALNVTFPTVAGDSGGVAVDGTATANQKLIALIDQPITNWPPGATLWLVWQMTDPTGKAQGLGIDNFSFAANTSAPVIPTLLSATAIGSTNIVFSFPTLLGASYQLYFKTNLNDAVWQPVGTAWSGSGTTLYSTNSAQGFYTLKITP